MAIEVYGELCCHGFVAMAIPGGYSWTLASAFGKLLDEAEQQFGPRDMTWTPLGVEIGDQAVPRVWYPGNRRSISILLAKSARFDSRQALFQLAHEVVHILSPTGDKNAPRIEEGLATLFADAQSDKNRWGHRTVDPAYLSAKEDVERLLAIDTDAILKVRQREPSFLQFSPQILRDAVPALPNDLAEALCVPFSYI